MAGSSLFALIDDIATLLDDVSVMTKVATKKTVGVLGDDLALNAQQIAGINADRELPVVMAVAKGSAINKLILVPSALVISMILPALVTPLLMIGGAYLCFEGVEKLYHRWAHREAQEQSHQAHLRAVGNAQIDLVAFEKEKIKAAIRTDFILSAEIIVIALGAAAGAPLLQQSLMLGLVAILMTVGVYGLVAAIIKLDDLGLYWLNKEGKLLPQMGAFLLKLAPYLMKSLSVAGTAAMFLVGGGILVHGMPFIHHQILLLTEAWLWVGLWRVLLEGSFGVIAGSVVLAMVLIIKAVIRPRA